MNRALALIELTSKLKSDEFGGVNEVEFKIISDFLDETQIEKLTPENILDNYIEYLETKLGLPHD